MYNPQYLRQQLYGPLLDLLTRRQRPKIPHNHLHQRILRRPHNLNTPLHQLRQAPRGELADVLALREHFDEELQEDDDVGGVGLLGAGQEVDELDGQGVHQLLGGVLRVATDFED